MDRSSGIFLLRSQKGEQMILFLPCPTPASVAYTSFSRQFKKEVMLAGCVRHRKRQRNQAPCHQPLTSAGGMWEKAKPNPSQIKLACKRPSFLRNFWIKYWLQPARFHWKWLCQLVLNNSLSCICFLCCFPLSVDFPVDTGKLNLLLNTFLFLLTWQTWIFASDWKQDGWLCVAHCPLPEWPAGGGDNCPCAADKISASFGFSGRLQLVPVAAPVTLPVILAVLQESCCTPYGTSQSCLHWASFVNRRFISKPSSKSASSSVHSSHRLQDWFCNLPTSSVGPGKEN